MKKIALITLLAFLFLSPELVQAQFKVIDYDHANAYFNNGQELPSGSKMIFQGQMPVKSDRIEAALFKSNGNKEKKPLYTTEWVREPNDKGLSFRIPFHYELHSNSSYDFRFTYYRLLSKEEKQQLTSTLHQALDRYIDHSFTPKGVRVKLIKTQQVAIEDLNTIIEEGLTYYKTANGMEFQGFSDLVRGAFANVERHKLNGKSYADLGFQQGTDSTNKTSDEAALYTYYINELKAMVQLEINNFLGAPMLVQTDVRDIEDYHTDKAGSALALNVGYGGVLLEGNTLDNITYGTSPYVGISLPLANRIYASQFLANTSISLGVFTKNFVGEEDSEISGPIFGRPYFVGLGYNVFRFIKINAGATALETRGSSSIGGGSASFDPKAISIRPFVGISAEIDLWLGLRERR